MRFIIIIAALMGAACSLVFSGEVRITAINVESDTAKAVTGVQAQQIFSASQHTTRTDNPHAVTATQLGALTAESDPLSGPRLAMIELNTNSWDAAVSWGNHALAGYLPAALWQSWLATNTYVRAETDQAALAAIATQRVERVYDSAQPSRYFTQTVNGTGTVYEVTGPFTNLMVTLSDDFEETVTHTRPAWTNSAFPFLDAQWDGGESGGRYYFAYASGSALWQSSDTVAPSQMIPDRNAQGTATVSVASIYYVTNALSRFASEAQVTAATGQVSRATDAKLIALNPYVSTVYGDLARTNTAGFAAFAPTNASQVNMSLAPSLGYATNTAWFSYHVTGLISEAKSVAYAVNMLDTNRSGTATLWYFNASGVAVASNTAALPSGTRSNDPMAWFTNTLSFLNYDFQFVTNGTIRLSVTLGNAGAFLPPLLYSGGASPLTLELLSAPLSYVPYTKFGGKVDAVGGTAADLQISGARVKGTLDLNGVARTNWPDSVSGSVMTQATSHVMAQYVDENGYVTQQILRVGITVTTNRWGPRISNAITNGMSGPLALGGVVLNSNRIEFRTDTETNLIYKSGGHLVLQSVLGQRIYFFNGPGSIIGAFDPLGLMLFNGYSLLLGDNSEAGFRYTGGNLEINPRRSGSGDVRVTDGNLTVANTNTASIFIETGTPSWIVLTNIASACTITNDNLRPARIFAAAGAETSTTGAVSFANLRTDAAPVYFTVQGFLNLRFPSAYVVGGGSWQTNRVNIFTAWMDGTNTFVSPITTREIY